MGPPLRDGGRPGRSLHDAAGRGRRLLVAAPAQAHPRRPRRPRPPRHLPARPLPRGRARRAGHRLALVRAGRRYLAPDRARASRPLRRAARAAAPHAPGGVAPSAIPSAERRRAPPCGCPAGRSRLVRRGAGHVTESDARRLRARGRLPRSAAPGRTAGPSARPRRQRRAAEVERRSSPSEDSPHDGADLQLRRRPSSRRSNSACARPRRRGPSSRASGSSSCSIASSRGSSPCSATPRRSRAGSSSSCGSSAPARRRTSTSG